MLPMIRTSIVVIYFSLALLLVMPWLILWSLLTGRPDFMYRVTMKGVRCGVRIAGIRVHVEGLENIPPGVCIFAANHVSNMDPLAFVPAIPRRVSLLAKKEVFRIPILSKAMRMAKLIPVDREDREAAASSVDIAVKHLNDGLSFAVYPEGTRSRDGRLLPFKKGTFVMAIEAGVSVVPVSISGAQKLMRKGEWTLQPGEVTIRFGPAVDASRYTMDRRSELLARVEALVAAGLPEDQQPLRAAKS
jgi:1-acyl-sn-glycerol-3-phosphate acyltransferase